MLIQFKLLLSKIKYHRFAIILAFLFGFISLLFAINAKFPFYSDEVSHFLIARGAWLNKELLLSPWGRPAFTILYTIPAQFDYFWCRVLSVILSFFIGISAYCIAINRRISNAAFVIPFVYFQQEFFLLSYGALTETIGALIIGIASYFFLKRQFLNASILYSILPLARAEGFFIGLFIGFIYIYYFSQDFYNFKSWEKIRSRFFYWAIRIVLLALPSILWNFLGYLISGDPIWIWSKNTYTSKSIGYYGMGPWYDYLIRMPEVLGVLSTPFFFIGLIRGITDIFNFSRNYQNIVNNHFLCALWLFFFILQSVLWTFGLFGTGGYNRFFVTIAPLAAVIALDGTNFVLSRINKILTKFSPIIMMNLLLIVSTAILVSDATILRGQSNFNNLREMYIAYQDYVNKNGEPPLLLINNPYFRLINKVNYSNRVKKLTIENAEHSPTGTIILWDYTQWKKTEIQPEYFYHRETLDKTKNLRGLGNSYLHLVHNTNPGWKELIDITRDYKRPEKNTIIKAFKRLVGINVRPTNKINNRQFVQKILIREP